MLSLVAAVVLSAQADTTADLHLYRYWRDPDVTNVVALVSVPLSGLTYAPGEDGRTRVARYEIDMSVTDADGNVLLSEAWGNRVRVGMGDVPASSRAVENVSFDLRPGVYSLVFEVRDSISGTSRRLQESVEASDARPRMGSVMLAQSIARANEGEAVPAGSLVRNGYVIAPDMEGRQPSRGAALRMYTEVYPPSGPAGEQPASVQVVLTPTDNPSAAQVAPAIRKRYPRGGGLEIVNLPLDGLEPGSYEVELRVSFADSVVSEARSLTIEEPPQAVASATREKLFDGWVEPQLDSLWEKSKYFSTPRDRRLYEGLSMEGKRNFLEDFWARRDPTPGDPNEGYLEFRKRVDEANREFDLSGNPGEGWSSARGRVWILRGEPFERIVRTTRPDSRANSRASGARDYEIWRYAGARTEFFLFFDQTGFDNFHQIFSTDPEEFTQPNWPELFPDEDMDFLTDLLGVGRTDRSSAPRNRE